MRFWQATVPTNPPTVVWLENPHDWMRTVYAIEQGTTRRTQVREPSPEELGIPGTERRDYFACWYCHSHLPVAMFASRSATGKNRCTNCEAQVKRRKGSV